MQEDFDLTGLILKPGFRFVFGSRENVASLKAEDIKNYAIYSFVEDFPECTQLLRPMHYQITDMKVLNNRWSDENFPMQDRICSALKKVLLASSEKDGLIVMCNHGEIRSKTLAYFLAFGAALPVYEAAKDGKIIEHSNLRDLGCPPDVLFRCDGMAYEMGSTIEFA